MNSRQTARIAREQMAAKAQAAKIHMAKVRADEDAAIAGIPPAIVASEDAQKEFVAKGGCTGCCSQILAVHSIPRPATDGDLY